MKRLICLLSIIFVLCASLVAQTDLPAGTRLRVQLQSEVDTRTSHVGDVVKAEIIEQVQDGTSVVVPVGAHLSGHVLDVSPESKSMQTHALLQLVFDQIAFPDGKNIKTYAIMQDLGRTIKVDMNGRATIHPLSHDFALKSGRKLWLRIDTVAEKYAPNQTSSEPPAKAEDENRNKPVPVGPGISPPRLLQHVEPEFTKEARKGQHQGTVAVRATVGTDGRIHDAHVIRGLGWGLDENALAAVRKWVFDPATKDGRKVAVFIDVQVSFRLSK